MKTEMYKAFDKADGKLSMFAVQGNIMAVSTFAGEHDSWLSSNGFDIEDYAVLKTDMNIMSQPVLIWSEEL